MTNQELAQRVESLENDLEGLFASFLGLKASKQTIEEIVVGSVIDHFKISRRDFFGKEFGRGRSAAVRETTNADIIEARKWVLTIMRFVLLKTSYSLKLNFPFYHCSREQSHRKLFESAMNPKTERDLKTRATFLSISKKMRETCIVEGIFSPELNSLFL